MGKQKYRKVLPNLALALLGIIVALGLLELGARLLPSPFKGPENGIETCAGPLGWRGKPFYETVSATEDYVHNLKLNSVGMHDGEHLQAKPEGTFRILMLGDSFVQATQVREEETAHQVLEDLLNEDQPSPKFEVISAGVGGWGTGQQLMYYRSEGRLYQPDLVILMFFLGNDVKDNLPGRGITVDGRNCYMSYFVLQDDQLDPTPWAYAPGIKAPTGRTFPGQKLLLQGLNQLHQHSWLYTQLEPLVVLKQEPVSVVDFYTKNNPTFDYAFDLTVSLVKQLQSEAQQDGAELMVVLISPIDLVEFSRMSPAEREVLYRRFPTLRAAEKLDPNLTLTQIFSKAGIKTLALLPTFLEDIDKTGEKLYFSGDKHWTSEGNHLAGKAIYHWLRESYPLP
jgi:hypothetical protein